MDVEAVALINNTVPTFKGRFDVDPVVADLFELTACCPELCANV
jgi:hypothetical protein